MSGLAIPTHVARARARQRQAEAPTSVPILPVFQGPREKVHDIDTPIPEGLPDPGHWRVTLMPVGQRRVSKGNIIFADETMDVQDWTHLLWKVCKLGPLIYRGPAYAGFDKAELEAAMPRIGEVWLVDPKQPRRYHYADILFIVVNDDQLWSRVDPAHISNLKFRGLEL